jgi:hypothetical protein
MKARSSRVALEVASFRKNAPTGNFTVTWLTSAHPHDVNQRMEPSETRMRNFLALSTTTLSMVQRTTPLGAAHSPWQAEVEG